MINLLQETLDTLKENGKSERDVIWAGCTDFQIPWKDFAEISNKEYDDSYGSNKVKMDLLIVGADFWLERHEYDGSEWWEFKTLPSMPNKIETSKIAQEEAIWR
jgi:hypothetical protein